MERENNSRGKGFFFKTRKTALTAMLLLVIGLGAFGVVVAADGNLFSQTTVVTSTNTVTYSTFTTVTKSTDTALTTLPVTETSTLQIQPVVTVTTATVAGPTVTTTLTTSTSTAFTTVVVSETDTVSTTSFTPMVMYWTASEANPQGFFESVNPINIGSTISESITSNHVTLGLTTTNSTASVEQSSGFYMIVGTIAQLNVAIGHGLTLTGFDTSSELRVNLWIDPASWSWTPVASGVSQFSTTGSTTGAYGIGEDDSAGLSLGSMNINSGTHFGIALSGSYGTNACNSYSSYTIAEIASCMGSLASTTPVAIWVGLSADQAGNYGPATSTITAMYLS